MAGESIEWDFLAHAANDAARAEARTQSGPDLSGEACACGRFGPWGDGTAFYCEAHVPPELRFRGQYFNEIGE